MGTPRRDLPDDELAACLIAERVLGVRAEPWDVDGRNGVVDAILHYPNGRIAAFEVTKLVRSEDAQRDSVLSNDDFEWPNLGRWWWDATVGSVRDIPTLRECYRKVIQLCEAHGTTRPEHLNRLVRENDPDVTWVLQSSVSMLGHPDVPAREDGLERPFNVLPPGGSGGPDLVGLGPALTEAFAQPHIAKHFAKLANSTYSVERDDGRQVIALDEQHLFMPVHPHVLPDDAYLGLWHGTELPTEPPPIPEHVTHLWLHVGTRTLLWGPQGWESHPRP